MNTEKYPYTDVMETLGTTPPDKAQRDVAEAIDSGEMFGCIGDMWEWYKTAQTKRARAVVYLADYRFNYALHQRNPSAVTAWGLDWSGYNLLKIGAIPTSDDDCPQCSLMVVGKYGNECHLPYEFCALREIVAGGFHPYKLLRGHIPDSLRLYG